MAQYYCGNPECSKVETKHKEFKRCSSCKVKCYCSENCQRANWKIHKIVCIDKLSNLKRFDKKINKRRSSTDPTTYRELINQYCTQYTFEFIITC